MIEFRLERPPVDISRPFLDVEAEIAKLPQLDSGNGSSDSGYVLFKRLTSAPNGDSYTFITRIGRDGNAKVVVQRKLANGDVGEVIQSEYDRDYSFNKLSQAKIDGQLQTIAADGEEWNSQIIEWGVTGPTSTDQNSTGHDTAERLAREFDLKMEVAYVYDALGNQIKGPGIDRPLEVYAQDSKLGHLLAGEAASEPEDIWAGIEASSIHPVLESDTSAETDKDETIRQLREELAAATAQNLEVTTDNAYLLREIDGLRGDFDSEVDPSAVDLPTDDELAYAPEGANPENGEAVIVRRSEEVAPASSKESKALGKRLRGFAAGARTVANPESLAKSWHLRNNVSETGQKGKEVRRTLRRVVAGISLVPIFRTPEQVRAERQALRAQPIETSQVPASAEAAPVAGEVLPEGVTFVVRKDGRKTYFKDKMIVSPVDFLNKKLRAERDGIPYEPPPRKPRRTRSDRAEAPIATTVEVNGHGNGRENADAARPEVVFVAHRSSDWMVIAEAGQDGLPANAGTIAEEIVEHALEEGATQELGEIEHAISETLGASVRVLQPAGAGNGHS